MARSTKEDTLRRRDARENHERLIEAARRVFASSGFEASLAAIASEAGVGRATLYRNFPDKFALVAAIFEDNLVALETLASSVPYGGLVLATDGRWNGAAPNRRMCIWIE